MNLRMPDRYALAAVALILVGVSLFIALPLVTPLGDTTSAVGIIVGMVCVMVGSFILILSGGVPMDPRFVGILPAQGSLTLYRISSDRGIDGNAHFLPPRLTGKSRVIQLNPASEYDGSQISTETSFLETNPRGFVTPPSCDLLVQDLKERHTMVIPEITEELTLLLNEVIEDSYDLASRVSVTWYGRWITITLHEYQFIESCRIIAKNSPQCCSRYPCPVCSLCAVLITEGLDEIIILEHCFPVYRSRDVTVTLLRKSLPDRNPEIQVPITFIDTVATSEDGIRCGLSE